MHDFSSPFYTDHNGVEFLTQLSTGHIFTHRPDTEELVYLCHANQWEYMARKLAIPDGTKPKETKR